MQPPKTVHGRICSQIAAFSFLLLVGCSGSDSDTAPVFSGDGLTTGAGNDANAAGPGGAGAQDETPPPALDHGDYPAGPYGESDPAVGEVVENLSFEGFRRIANQTRVTSGSLESFSFSDLRDEGASYALLHTATTWCPSCRTAADDLSQVGDSLSNRGVLVIELLLEGQSYETPGDNELKVWADGSDLTITTLRGADARTEAVFPSREYVYIIELSTMEVVWAQRALFSSPSITEQGIAALEDFL